MAVFISVINLTVRLGAWCINSKFLQEIVLSHLTSFLSTSSSILLLKFQYTIAMMGYGPEDKNAVLELTYNYGVKEYDKGNAYAQVGFLFQG